MAEMMEVFEDMGDKVKKTVKNKPFLIACVVVGGVALYTGWKKYNSTSEQDATAYGAIGYAGYPSTVGGGGADNTDMSMYDSYLESLENQMNNMGEDFNKQLDGIYDEIGGLYDEMGSNTEAFDKVTITPTVVVKKKDEELERQKLLDQMKANSDAYHIVTDSATKEALHKENAEIAEQLGLTYNASAGLWMDDGNVAYVTELQAKKAAEADGASGFVSNKQHNEEMAAAITFDSNVDYQAEINKAIASGASASVIDNLNKQREAKINATGTTTTKANSYFDQNTDYQALINKAQAAGASQNVIDNLTAQRNAKIAANSTKK